MILTMYTIYSAIVANKARYWKQAEDSKRLVSMPREEVHLAVAAGRARIERLSVSLEVALKE